MANYVNILCLENGPLTHRNGNFTAGIFRIQAIYPPFFPSSRRSASFPRFRVVPPLGRLTCITMTIDPLTLALNVAPEHHNGEMAHED